MAPFEPRSKRRQKKKKCLSFDWLIMIIVAVVISISIRMYAYEPFDVIGPSMQPTMNAGDLVLVNKWKYRLTEPERGDVVVFHALEEKDYIKRVIALPGETVEMKNQQLLINGEKVTEPYLPQMTQTDDFPAQKVPAGHLFVMGDNRVDSRDSRTEELGPIEQSKLVGKVELVYWPITNMQMLK